MMSSCRYLILRQRSYLFLISILTLIISLFNYIICNPFRRNRLLSNLYRFNTNLNIPNLLSTFALLTVVNRCNGYLLIAIDYVDHLRLGNKSAVEWTPISALKLD